ncbi:uncharacterized protein V6R79_024880 [Siganus canaliculatus]
MTERYRPLSERVAGQERWTGRDPIKTRTGPEQDLNWTWTGPGRDLNWTWTGPEPGGIQLLLCDVVTWW